MRNLDLELAARPAVRAARPAVPRVPFTPNIQLGLALAALGIGLAAMVALGHGPVAALVAIGIGLVWADRGRDGVVIAAVVAVGSLPYLALVLRLGAGI